MKKLTSVLKLLDKHISVSGIDAYISSISTLSADKFILCIWLVFTMSYRNQNALFGTFPAPLTSRPQVVVVNSGESESNITLTLTSRLHIRLAQLRNTQWIDCMSLSAIGRKNPTSFSNSRIEKCLVNRLRYQFMHGKAGRNTPAHSTRNESSTMDVNEWWRTGPLRRCRAVLWVVAVAWYSVYASESAVRGELHWIVQHADYIVLLL